MKKYMCFRVQFVFSFIDLHVNVFPSLLCIRVAFWKLESITFLPFICLTTNAFIYLLSFVHIILHCSYFLFTNRVRVAVIPWIVDLNVFCWESPTAPVLIWCIHPHFLKGDCAGYDHSGALWLHGIDWH